MAKKASKRKVKDTAKRKAFKMPELKVPTQVVMKQPLTDAQMERAIQIFKTEDKAQKTLDGFDNFLSRVGLNNDNALSAGMYTFNLMTRNRVQLEAAYRGSWVVGAIVDCVAEDMTRAGIDITTNEGDEDIKDFMSAMSKLRIWQSVQSLVKWGRLYGGAIGVYNIEGQDPSTPLDIERVGKGQFKGITVFDRWQLNPDVVRCIESGPEMGLPKYYSVVSTPLAIDPSSETMTGQINIHHSRVMRMIGIELPFYQAITEMMWGESVLERLWDRLISFDNATMSSASLIDRANLRTVGVENLREIIAAGGKAQQGLEAMFEMMRLMQTNEGLTLLDKNDTHQTTAYSFAGLSDMLLQFGQQLSGACGIPLVRLFGQSPAGLSATGDADIRMYYDNINAQQEGRMRQGMEVLCRILWRSTFGKAVPKDFEFTFTPLWQMSTADKANVAKTNAETVIGAFEAGLVTRATGMKELRQSSGDTGIFSNISDEEIEAAEADPAPPMGEGENPQKTDEFGNPINLGKEGTAPAPGAQGGMEANGDPTTSLNGAQVTAMLSIVNQVSEGQIPRETAVNMMTAAFPISSEQASAILGQVGNGFVPEAPVEATKEAGKEDDKGDEPPKEKPKAKDSKWKSWVKRGDKIDAMGV